MTLPAGPVPTGLTDMDIDALTAPLGIELRTKGGPQGGVLDSVATVRDGAGHHVRWEYANGRTQLFAVGERVGIRVNLNDLRTAR